MEKTIFSDPSEDLFELMPIAIIMVNPELRLLQANIIAMDLIARCTGSAVEHIVPGAGLFTLAPSLQETFSPLIERAFARELIQSQALRIQRDGSVFFWEAFFVPFAQNGRVAGVLIGLTDVTTQTEEQDKIRGNEAGLRTLTDAVAQQIWSNQPDGSLDYCNQRFLNYNGLTTQEATKSDLDKTIHPDDRARVVGARRRAVSRGESLEIEERLRNADGTYRWFLTRLVPEHNSNHQIVKWYGTNTDIDDRKRAEEQLRQSERELLGAVFERSASGIVFTDLDGSIIQANRAYQNMLGYTEAELMATTVQALTHPDDLKQNLALRAQLLNTSRDGYQYEKRYQCKDGTFIWVRTSVSLIQDALGKPRFFMSVVEDITEHIEAYQLLEQRVQERTREIERRRQVAETLSDNLAILNSKYPLREILQRIVGQACNLLNAEGCAIYQLEEDRQFLRIRAAHGLPTDFVAELKIPMGQDEIGKAIINRTVTLNHNLQVEFAKNRPATDRLWYEWMTRITEHLHALIAIPLEVKDQIFGAIALYYREPREITGEEIQLALSIAHQAILAIENTRLTEQERQLATLTERQRLARELHDSVAQALYAIELQARTARNRLDRDPQRAHEPLDAVLALTNAALAEMRAVIFDLRPESLETEGLVAALEKQLGYLRARYNLEVKALFGAEPAISLDAKEALYRIAQESLQNVIRHARATYVELRLHQDDQVVVMEITDNGIGFDMTKSFPGHLGLHTMRERATQVGGIFKISSAPSAGTYVRVEIPI